MNIQEVIQTINQMQADGIIEAYAIGGAVGATFHLEPSTNGSKVLVHTDLTLSGAVAQYGRGVGMIQATAAALINQFANNLKNQLADPNAATAAKPISATSLAGPATPTSTCRSCATSRCAARRGCNSAPRCSI